ncbi:MAG TPA: hypothetical protein VM554_16075 [Acidisarcina sp.]|nr:hypothetical protein [Acidisarcina sp.]
MTRIGVIAALPGELKPLVKGWERKPGTAGIACWSRREDNREWVAACAGMGADAATRAFAEAEREGPLGGVISIGWAGALAPDYVAGEAYAVREVIDVRTSERYAASESPAGVTLVTTPTVASVREKQRLAKSYSAALVDMEAAAIGRLARARNIPFACFKAVTDGVDANLPDFNPFVTRSGQMRMPAFVLHCALRPWYWAPLLRMGKDSGRAAEALASQVLRFLNEPADQWNGSVEER